jgi:hypothetical protein
LKVETQDARIKAMVSLTEYRKESCEKGPNVIKRVEERKKTMRHFYGTHVVNEDLLVAKNSIQTLFSPLSNQSQKGITVPASPFIKQIKRNTVRGVELH